MHIQQNISLRPYNTFGIDANAKWFAQFNNAEELEDILANFGQAEQMVLGGGSNILLTKDFNGLVLKNDIMGIEEVKEDDEHVYLKVGAGENWHRFVMYCIDNGLAGVENLSLIPGNVGASPMQNIGAYGVEMKEVFYSLEAYHIKDQKLINFTLNDCEFGYRESVFKNKYKDQFIITNVTYRLSKKPSFNTSYGAINQELEKMGVNDLTIN